MDIATCCASVPCSTQTYLHTFLSQSVRRPHPKKQTSAFLILDPIFLTFQGHSSIPLPLGPAICRSIPWFLLKQHQYLPHPAPPYTVIYLPMQGSTFPTYHSIPLPVSCRPFRSPAPYPLPYPFLSHSPVPPSSPSPGAPSHSQPAPRPRRTPPVSHTPVRTLYSPHPCPVPLQSPLSPRVSRVHRPPEPRTTLGLHLGPAPTDTCLGDILTGHP